MAYLSRGALRQHQHPNAVVERDALSKESVYCLRYNRFFSSYKFFVYINWMKLFAYSFVYLFYFFLKIVWILLYIFSDEKFSANCGNNKFLYIRIWNCCLIISNAFGISLYCSLRSRMSCGMLSVFSFWLKIKYAQNKNRTNVFIFIIIFFVTFILDLFLHFIIFSLSLLLRTSIILWLEMILLLCQKNIS